MLEMSGGALVATHWMDRLERDFRDALSSIKELEQNLEQAKEKVTDLESKLSNASDEIADLINQVGLLNRTLFDHDIEIPS